MTAWHSLAIGSLIGSLFGSSPSQPEQLIVYTNPKASPLAAQFEQRDLPRLRAIAEEMDLELKVVNVARRGAPEEVAITPLVVFQNHQGRSVFQGRYADRERLTNFLRTARRIPQGAGGLTLESVPVWQTGRAAVGAPIKITWLEGELPINHDDEAFELMGRAAIASGFSQFELRDTHTFRRADRLLYMDFYPIAVEDDQLVISLALFSQFDCHTPVYTAYNDEIIGPMSEAPRLFAEAAAHLEQEVQRQLATSSIGDGFDPVPSATRVRSWEKLGLALPAPPRRGAAMAAITGPVPHRWILDPPAEGDSVGQFNFPAPLDSYSGRILSATATLEFAESRELSTAAGTITVPTHRVTMGDAALDDTVRDSIAADRFSEASFQLVQASAPPGALQWGETSQLFADGDFTLMGLPIPVQVRSEITPGVNDAGEPRLFVNASFRIPLADPFQIEGPPGPRDASENLEFFMDFAMRPAEPATGVQTSQP